MLKKVLILWLFVVCSLLSTANTYAGIKSVSKIHTQKILSIVIGNSEYESLPRIKNPTNDAELINKTLLQMGHEVILLKNAGRREIQELLRKTEKGDYYDLIVFFYAGQGFGVLGKNYILPTDSGMPESSMEATFEGINFEHIVSSLKNKADVFVGIFDACRYNPFDGKSDSLGGLYTLGNIPIGADVMLLYSTAPGAIALDGGGDNSPFTEALSETLLESSLDNLSSIARTVRRKVVEKTDGRQIPFYVDSTLSDVSLFANEIGNFKIAQQQRLKPPEKQSSLLTRESVDNINNTEKLIIEEYEEALGSNDTLVILNWLLKYPSDPKFESNRQTAYQKLTEIARYKNTKFDSGNSKGGVSVEVRIPEDSILSEKGQRSAIVVGINDYHYLPADKKERARLHDLRFAENDANNFSSVLSSGKMGVWQTKLLVGERAKRENVIRQTKKLLADASSHDSVLLYFSGHGSVDKYDDKNVFLMLQDSTTDESESGFDYYTLTRMIARSAANHIVVIIDACRSGNIGVGAKGDRAPGGFDQSMLTFIQQAHGKSRVLFTSSKGNQSSWEDDELSSGVFTHYLIKAIQGKSENRYDNQFVELGEIEDYTKQMVTKHTRSSEDMSTQEPTLVEFEGNAHSEVPIAFR